MGNPKLLEHEDLQDCKVQYYKYMVQYWLHENKNLDVAKSYLAIFNTKSVQADEAQWKEALSAHVMYLTLAQYDNEQNDMLNKVLTVESKKLDKLPVFKQVIKIFLKNEIAAWPMADEKDIKLHPAFQDKPHEGAAARWDM